MGGGMKAMHSASGYVRSSRWVAMRSAPSWVCCDRRSSHGSSITMRLALFDV